MRSPERTLRIVCLFLILILLGNGCGFQKEYETERVLSFQDGPKGFFQIEVPHKFKDIIGGMTGSKLGGNRPRITLSRESPGIYRIRLQFDLKKAVSQDNWEIQIIPAFSPEFHWAPHLTPREGLVMDQHCFRSPALIAGSSDKLLILVPDLELMKKESPVRWYMDLNALENRLFMGMSESKVIRGQFYERISGARYEEGPVDFGFYVLLPSSEKDLNNPFRRILSFLWEKWGKESYENGLPLPPDLDPYVLHTYNWAFNSWKDSVWQEFTLNGKLVGAPVFIVNVTQSPNYPGEINEREFHSVWNQAWFSSLRSASGLFRYARRTGDEKLRRRSHMTKELALMAPVREGFFDTVIATEMEMVDINGKKYNRSKGWETAFWGNSDRNPVNRPPGQPRNRNIAVAPYHILDMSWTSLLMLRWHEELERDPRLLEYARDYAGSLLKLQDETGFFPAWLDKKSLHPLKILEHSPESSMSSTFLLKLAEITGETKFRDAALKSIEAVINEIVPTGRWEDFETYWSSSSYGSGDLIGKKVARNNMHKQCNFSMFWTAEALYEAYKTTGRRLYLLTGQRVLDEMLMTQASWQPPFMHLPVLGGFGVMNCDGEWLDARESLFAEIIVKYGLELGKEEYIQRGLSALRSSFVMMYCPQNPKTKIQWERKHPFFGPEDYGFTMENYGHGGRTDSEGRGMGVFTIYDWGNGAASEAYNRMLDHYGEKLVFRSK